MKKIIVKHKDFLFFIGFVLILVLFGLYEKQFHRDVLGDSENPIEDGVFDDFLVGVLSEDYAKILTENMKEVLPYSPNILKIRVLSEPEFEAFFYGFDVRVEKVFAGDEFYAGEKFFLTDLSWITFFDDSFYEEGAKTMNMGFSNLLFKDKEYLVFLDNKKDTIDGRNLGTLPGYSISPVFSYEETKSYPHESVISGSNVAYYSDLKNSEFFCSTQKAVDYVYELKRYLLELYP